MTIKGTRKKAASTAGKSLRDPKTTTRGRKVAASTLAQRKAPKRTTSGRVASVASKILRDASAKTSTRSVAGSALSQARVRRKTRKPATK